MHHAEIGMPVAVWPRTGTACLSPHVAFLRRTQWLIACLGSLCCLCWHAHSIPQQQRVSLCAPSACFTHAGYGDITPVTFLETGVVIIFQVVGVGYFGYLLNTISKSVSKILFKGQGLAHGCCYSVHTEGRTASCSKLCRAVRSSAHADATGLHRFELPSSWPGASKTNAVCRLLLHPTPAASIMAASGPRARRRDAVRRKLQVLGRGQGRPCGRLAGCAALFGSISAVSLCFDPYLIGLASAPQQQQDVDEVMAAAGLGAHLRQHIRQFYTERWQPERGAQLVYLCVHAACGCLAGVVAPGRCLLAAGYVLLLHPSKQTCSALTHNLRLTQAPAACCLQFREAGAL